MTNCVCGHNIMEHSMDLGCKVFPCDCTITRDEAYRAVEAQSAQRGLVLAILCDTVLGEDAEDRSDDALIRAVGKMVRANAGAREIIETVAYADVTGDVLKAAADWLEDE